ncbi:hypothetical protein [Cronobacter sakazakii]|uniref:hypothetical protein n=1 Tax=Cronobacter sakazakii TaxID=28141 RepID=UPI001AE3862E|nr:hypothetical protein [Cronobacter sakazakii]ELY2495319.1 hypothetical protein [Cronobacter muytjensii]ELY2596562.1 hypothetical protein [Cronobacter sakazakii]MDT3542267.1 hypothetical protein [Cronobacter sakazakii]MDT3628602.1 hypothetical protein [Cronobacter sakazakii]
MILPNLIFARPLPNGSGYTWTLTTRLGAILRELESSYGERDKSWTILGIEFEKNGPQIWYPGNCKNIAIQLAHNALDNEMLACYQLSHEAVHLLAPSGNRSAPVIEEGLATMFSEDFVEREFGAKNVTNLEKYVEAAAIVRQLLKKYPDAITKLRSIEPAFYKMTASTFKSAGINVEDELATKLLSRF